MNIDLTIPDFLDRRPVAVNYMVFANGRDTFGWTVADRSGKERGNFRNRQAAQARADQLNRGK